MKKFLCIISSFVLLFSLGCTSEKDLNEKRLTIVESVTKCNAIEEDWFFAYDSEGEWYKVLWPDTDNLSEGDELTVFYEEITEISYESGYPDGYTPKLQITAKKVK